MSTPPTLLDLIVKVDNAPLDFSTNYAPYYTLHFAPDPRPHGFIHPSTISSLSSLDLPSCFSISHDDRTVILEEENRHSTTTASEHFNTALQQVVDQAIQRDIFPTLSARHSEHFLIPGARHFIQVERFAATLFGIATRGAHMTAYTRNGPSSPGGDSGFKIWVARRSPHLHTYPGMLDSTVAGGVKSEDRPRDCIVAESVEEASLPASVLGKDRIKSTGVITACNINARTGLYHSEILYVYDLELPEDIVPTPGDEEVQEFTLMEPAEVRTRMENGEFKPNVCPVLIDFLIRHGVVDEKEKGYVDICQRLRRKLPVPVESDS